MPRKPTFIAADTREPIRGEPIKTDEYVPWDDRPNNTFRTVGLVVGCSGTQLYNLVAQGELDRVSLAGRSLITTESLKRFLEKAVPHPVPEPLRLPKRSSQVPTPRGRRARTGAQP